MRRRWKGAVCTLALAVAAVLGGVTPAVSHAAPAAANKDFSNPAIVILGYGLNPDGTMRTILRRRVLTGLAVAQFFPGSPIIVTGGTRRTARPRPGRCTTCCEPSVSPKTESSLRTRRTARCRTPSSPCRWPSRLEPVAQFARDAISPFVNLG